MAASLLDIFFQVVISNHTGGTWFQCYTILGIHLILLGVGAFLLVLKVSKI
jgi:hypothetical protein